MAQLEIREVLSRLAQVKPGGDRQWTALCPAHDDKQRSLSVREADDGRVLLFCHAGCSFATITAALGLNGSKAPTPAKPEREIVARYAYRDETGKLVYEVLRYSPKGFSQRRPMGDGWEWNLRGVRPLPYRLPELRDALARGERIYVPEGEKDCDRLAALGLCSTCNSSGAGKWRDAHAEHFPAGADVVVLPDADEPGRKHADAVARSLHARGCVVRILQLPGLAEKQDVSDWISAGGDAEQLAALADAAPIWTPGAMAAKPAAENDLADDEEPANSDLGNSTRFVRAYAEKVKFCKALGGWLVWDGKRWRRDALGRVLEFAKRTVREMLKEAIAIDDDKERRAAITAALSTQSAAKLRAMIELSASDPKVAAEESEFDTHIDLLNVANGMIDLASGELRPHDPRAMCTQLANVKYDPTATAPTFTAFLDRIFQGNAKLVAYVQKALGYSLKGNPRERLFFVAFGCGANGKSSLMNVMADVCGDYASETPTETLLRKRHGDQSSNDLARLRGARFVAADESDPGRKLDVAKMKRVTGGERIAARFLFQEFFSFAPRFVLWISTNFLPDVPGDDEAAWDRLRCIPFLERIPEDERDLNLREKLRGEASGILAWLVKGAIMYNTDGLKTPEAVLRATGKYRSECDPVARFLAEQTSRTEGARVGKGELYAAYAQWAEGCGEEPATKKTFGQRVSKEFEGGRKGSQRWWDGLTLKVTHDTCDACADDFSRSSYSRGKSSEVVSHVSPVTEIAPGASEMPVPVTHVAHSSEGSRVVFDDGKSQERVIASPSVTPPEDDIEAEERLAIESESSLADAPDLPGGVPPLGSSAATVAAWSRGLPAGRRRAWDAAFRKAVADPNCGDGEALPFALRVYREELKLDNGKTAERS